VRKHLDVLQKSEKEVTETTIFYIFEHLFFYTTQKGAEQSIFEKIGRRLEYDREEELAEKLFVELDLYTLNLASTQGGFPESLDEHGVDALLQCTPYFLESFKICNDNPESLEILLEWLFKNLSKDVKEKGKYAVEYWHLVFATTVMFNEELKKPLPEYPGK